MLRTLFCASTLALLGLGCSPCARLSNAEATISDKGKGCNADTTYWESSRVSRCDQNLSKCSPDDLKVIDKYIQCLDTIPACTDSSKSASFGVARFECAIELAKLSFNCAAALR